MVENGICRCMVRFILFGMRLDDNSHITREAQILRKEG